MIEIKGEKLMQILTRAFNYIDPRLVLHGQRVTYIVMKMLEYTGEYDHRAMYEICFLTLFHDMGAYKTEDVSKAYEYERISHVEHSIYGYLFIKYWSPLKEYAEILLHHHSPYQELRKLDIKHEKIAQMISLADFIDLYLEEQNDVSFVIDMVEKKRDTEFSGEVIDLLFKQMDGEHIIRNRMNVESYKELISLFSRVEFSIEEMYEYLYMLVYAIDFRSFSTLLHTMNAVIVSEKLSCLFGLDEYETEKVKIGTMLHDIGKIGIPIEVLESPDRLTPVEMDQMRKHVEYTKEIMDGCIHSDIVAIASRHHEKLNGTGYPVGINASEIEMGQRIVAVADIVSALTGVRSYKEAFSKEKVVSILYDMSQKGDIDTTIVELMIENYDSIIGNIDEFCLKFMPKYDQFVADYISLKAIREEG